MKGTVIEVERRGGDWWAKVQVAGSPFVLVVWLEAPEGRTPYVGERWEVGLIRPAVGGWTA